MAKHTSISRNGTAAAQVPGSPACLGWYFNRAGERMGPCTEHELVGLIFSGQLHPGAEVWQAYSEGDHTRLVATRASATLGVRQLSAE